MSSVLQGLLCCGNNRTGVGGKHKAVSMAMHAGADAGELRLARGCRHYERAPSRAQVRARQLAPALPS
jgi:hypothetical protein